MSDGMSDMALQIQAEKRKQLLEEVKNYSVQDRLLDLKAKLIDIQKEIDDLIRIDLARR